MSYYLPDGHMILHVLEGYEHPAMKYVGKTITAAELDADGERFYLSFSDGSRIVMHDNQSCCEHRYMVIDDDLSDLVGREFAYVEVKAAPNEEDEYGEHEVAFVEIGTTENHITIATHNEHNGYYGGFSLELVEIDQ